MSGEAPAGRGLLAPLPGRLTCSGVCKEEQGRFMRYALGVDGGGSKTDAVLMDETGCVVGWGRGGPAHSLYSSPEAVQQAYDEAVSQALAEAAGEGFWVSDRLRGNPVLDLVRARGPVLGFAASDEVDTAFASAQEEWGFMVLSGTGSRIQGRTRDGRRLHCGGLGPVLGDYGSAYEVGLHGIRAAFTSRWLRSRRTSLEQAIPSLYGVESLEAVFHKVYVSGISRREVAAAARMVDQHAEAGDEVARGCLTRAADELAGLLVDAIRELGMAELDFAMIGVGSVAQKSRIWWQRICERVR